MIVLIILSTPWKHKSMNEKISGKLIAIIIVSSLVVGGVGGWLFNRVLIPKINAIPFLMKYNLSPGGASLVIILNKKFA